MAQQRLGQSEGELFLPDPLRTEKEVTPLQPASGKGAGEILRDLVVALDLLPRHKLLRRYSFDYGFSIKAIAQGQPSFTMPLPVAVKVPSSATSKVSIVPVRLLATIMCDISRSKQK